MVNNVMFVSRGRMLHSAWNKRKEKKGGREKNRFSKSWRTGTSFWCTLQRAQTWRRGTSHWCLKRKPPQRPVKIAHSVYCVFDPLGRTAETRRGEAKRIVVPTWEKLPHELFPFFFFLSIVPSIRSTCFIPPFDQRLLWKKKKRNGQKWRH